MSKRSNRKLRHNSGGDAVAELLAVRTQTLPTNLRRRLFALGRELVPRLVA